MGAVDRKFDTQVFVENLGKLVEEYEKGPEAQKQASQKKIKALLKEIPTQTAIFSEFPKNRLLEKKITKILPDFESNPTAQKILSSIANALRPHTLFLPSEIILQILIFAGPFIPSNVCNGWEPINFEARILHINKRQIAIKDLARKSSPEPKQKGQPFLNIREDFDVIKDPDVVENIVKFICRAGDSCREKLQYLDLSDIILTSEQLDRIANNCPFVTYLEFDRGHLTTQELECVGKLINLVSLKINGTIKQKLDRGLPDSMTKLTKLTNLSLSGIDLSKCPTISKVLPRLVSLSLNSYIAPNFRGKSFHEDFIGLLPLKKLELVDPNILHLEDDGFLRNLVNLKQLESFTFRKLGRQSYTGRGLRLKQMESLKEATFNATFEYIDSLPPKLESLCIHSLPGSSSDINPFSGNLTSLMHLDIRFNQIEIETLMNLKRLKTLRLESCRCLVNFPDVIFDDLVELQLINLFGLKPFPNTIVNNLHKLEKLELRGLPVTFNYRELEHLKFFNGEKIIKK